MKKRIVFLMSDTGGGHRAAAEAIAEALKLRYGEDQLDITLVDVFREMRWPLNKMPEFYPWILNKSTRLWGWGYHLVNAKPVYALNKRTMYFSNKRRLIAMVKRYPADVVVSVHSLITSPVYYAYQQLQERPPFLTVVTDLVSTPRYWYDRRMDFTFLPTEAAFRRGVKLGMNPDKMEVVGLPVHPRFANLREREAVRREHGWDEVLPTIMMVAGGEGMGPMFETAQAIDALKVPCQLVIIAGKNATLKQKLETTAWDHPVHVYGFVRDMPDKMVGADVIVTKAGPATISEAFIAGLPVILNDFIPGQEKGNVTHVVDNDAGVFADDPQKVAQAVYEWLSGGGEELERRKANARRLANPDAVWKIADAVWEYASKNPVPVKRAKFISRVYKRVGSTYKTEKRRT